MVFGLLLFVGMPYPQNLETAKEVEGIVRENGAVPATIAILDGMPCIGMYVCIIIFSLVCAFNCYVMFLSFTLSTSDLV